MRTLIVLLKGSDYKVECRKDPHTVRYFTDTTLPDEVKHKLGLLMFGSKDTTVGWRMGVQSDWISGDSNISDLFAVRVSEDTYKQVIGRISHDTRSQGEGQGQKDSE